MVLTSIQKKAAVDKKEHVLNVEKLVRQSKRSHEHGFHIESCQGPAANAQRL